MYLLCGTWSVNTSSGFPFWEPPPRCAGAIDMATLDEIAAANPTQPRGAGLFLCHAIPHGWDGAVLTGDDIRESHPSGWLRSAWRSHFGGDPSGDTIAHMLFRHLAGGRGAEALLQPTNRLRSEIWLGGRIVNRRFDVRAGRHSRELCAVLRRDLTAARETAMAGEYINPVTLQTDWEYHRRIADALLEKYAGGNRRLRAELWQRLKPKQWERYENPLPHNTTISESFDKADSATLGPDLTWTDLDGDWQVVTNAAQTVGTTNEQHQVSRADSDLSSVDHYAQTTLINIVNLQEANRGLIVRKDSSATLTYYHLDAQDNAASTDTWRTFKRVAGSFTAIGTNTTVNVVVNDVLKGEANGSSISRYRNGSSQDTATDTAIVSGTRCGLSGYRSGAGAAGARVDSWSAGDLAAAVGRIWQLSPDQDATPQVAGNIWEIATV